MLKIVELANTEKAIKLKPSIEGSEKNNQSHQKNYLTSEGHVLALHTKLAQVLFAGSWKKGRFGLTQFASLMKIIWQAAKNDDPYAEWYLLKIYDAIQTTQKKMQSYEVKIKAQVEQMRGFKIEIFKNPEPVKQALNFGTPFAFMGAVLVENFDFINRQLYTFKRIGMIPQDNLMPITLLQEIQKVFVLASKWKHTGVTRKDILEKNPKYQKAMELFGEEVPEAIQKKEIKFSFLPR